MSEPTSGTWGIEKFQSIFKEMYDTVAAAAKSAISEKISKKIPNTESLVLPWDASKIDMHFEEPESGQTGKVCALKILEIPYDLFKPAIDTKIDSNDGYVAAVMNIFINPIITSCKDAFEKKNTEYARLYVQYGTTKDSKVTLYVIYNGEVSEESAMHFESEDFDNFILSEEPIDTDSDEIATEGLFGFGKKKFVDRNPDYPGIDTQMLSWSEFEPVLWKQMKSVYADLVKLTEAHLKSNKSLKSIATVGSKTPRIDEDPKSVWFLPQCEYEQLPYYEIVRFDSDKIKSMVGSSDEFINVYVAPLKQLMRDRIKHISADERFYPFLVELDNEIGINLSFAGLVYNFPQNTQIDNMVKQNLTGKITANESGAISTESVIENFMLEVKGAKRKESPNDFIAVLQKAGIEITLGMYIKEYVKWGWAPIKPAEWNKLKSTVDVNKTFKNYKTDIMKNGKKIGKEEHIYKDVSFKDHSCVLGVVKKVIPTKEPTFSLEGVWIRFYNKRKNKVIYKRVAKSAQFEKTVKTEGLFGLGSSYDYGFACDPSLVRQNKHTFTLTERTGKIVMRLNRLADGFLSLITPIQTHGVDVNIRNIYHEFQKISPDWDVATTDAIKEHEKDTASTMLTKFRCVDIFGRWSNRTTGEKGVDCYEYHILKWIYNVLCIVEVWSIRPEGYKEDDLYPSEITNIYAIFYNTATNQFATPLLASSGWNFKPNVIPNVKSTLIQEYQSSKKTTSIRDIGGKKNVISPNRIAELSVPAHLAIALKQAKDDTEKKMIAVLTESGVAELKESQDKLRSFIAHEDARLFRNCSFTETFNVGSNASSLTVFDSNKSTQFESVFSIKQSQADLYSPAFVTRLEKALDHIACESSVIGSFSVDTSKGIRIIAHIKK